MNLATEIFGNVIVVHTPDELGADQADGFVDWLTTLERQNVVLDLDGTEMLDSRGLTALVEGQQRLRELGGDVKLTTTNLNNRKILEMTRLDEHLEVFESVVDAVKTFRA